MNARVLLLCAASLTPRCYRSGPTEPTDGTVSDVSAADSSQPRPDPREYPRADLLHPGDVECAPDGGSCSDVLDCDGSWAPGPLPPPWWILDPPTSCVDSPRHERLEYLDDCGGNPSPGALACGAGVGDAVCGGDVTTLCKTSADCPRGMACIDGSEPMETSPSQPEWGVCTKTCDPAGNDPVDCVRCDYRCTRQGVCIERVAHGDDYR